MTKFAIIFGKGNYVSRNLELIRANGYIPLIIDYQSNPLADQSFFCLVKPGQEINQIEQFLKKHKGKVSLIINRIDPFVELHSLLVDHFQVPGPSYQATKIFREKSLLHQIMVDHELDFFRPRTLIINLNEIDDYAKMIQFPVVIKPFLGAHSKGVILVSNRDELNEAKQILKVHFDSSKAVKFHADSSDKILIEEYLDGKMIVPICYLDHKGKLHTLTYFDVIRTRDLGSDNMQLVYRTTPSKYPNYITQKIEYILQKLARIAGLKSTFLDPEFMIVGKKVYLIEINVRAGGFRYESMKYGFGLNIDQMSIFLALNQEFDDDFQFIKHCTACEIWEEKSGKVVKFILPKSKYLVEQEIAIKVGDEYLAPPHGNKSFGKFYVVSEKEDSLRIAKNIRKQIKIEFEES